MFDPPTYIYTHAPGLIDTNIYNKQFIPNRDRRDRTLYVSSLPQLSINNEERPECIPCNFNYSFKHVLIDCVDVADVLQTFYNVNNLSNLFTNVEGDTILEF